MADWDAILFYFNMKKSRYAKLYHPMIYKDGDCGRIRFQALWNEQSFFDVTMT